MAGLRCMHCHRGQNRYRHIAHPHVVYLYFISDHGLPAHYLYGNGFLAEYEEIHPVFQAQSYMVLVRRLPVTAEVAPVRLRRATASKKLFWG